MAGDMVGFWGSTRLDSVQMDYGDALNVFNANDQRKGFSAKDTSDLTHGRKRDY